MEQTFSMLFSMTNATKILQKTFCINVFRVRCCLVAYQNEPTGTSLSWSVVISCRPIGPRYPLIIGRPAHGFLC